MTLSTSYLQTSIKSSIIQNMKNQELLNLYGALQDINLKGVKFAHAVAKNIAIIKSEAESLQKAIDLSDEFKAFEEKRIELAKKHAKKDENGEAITEIIDKVTKAGRYIFENKEAEALFHKELDVLREENKEVVDAREKQLKEFTELLDKENDIKLFKISIKDIPEEISSKQMTAIFEIVSEE